MFSPQTLLDLERFKTEIVLAGDKEYSFGRKGDLQEHLHMLAAEFSGHSKLAFFHAATTVFIRRNLNPDLTHHNFKMMWAREADFLCENLDTRWLVSACDTLIDISDDKLEVATAVTGTLFMNTVKLYETERAALGLVGSDIAPDFKPGRTPLFDGMSGYMPVAGDMIANLLRRIKQADQATIAGQILNELIARAHQHDTVFQRFQTLREAAQKGS